jgi:hypothetical protein
VNIPPFIRKTNFGFCCSTFPKLLEGCPFTSFQNFRIWENWKDWDWAFRHNKTAQITTIDVHTLLFTFPVYQ